MGGEISSATPNSASNREAAAVVPDTPLIDTGKGRKGDREALPAADRFLEDKGGSPAADVPAAKPAADRKKDRAAPGAGERRDKPTRPDRTRTQAAGDREKDAPSVKSPAPPKAKQSGKTAQPAETLASVSGPSAGAAVKTELVLTPKDFRSRAAGASQGKKKKKKRGKAEAHSYRLPVEREAAREKLDSVLSGATAHEVTAAEQFQKDKGTGFPQGSVRAKDADTKAALDRRKEWRASVVCDVNQLLGGAEIKDLATAEDVNKAAGSVCETLAVLYFHCKARMPECPGFLTRNGGQWFDFSNL